MTRILPIGLVLLLSVAAATADPSILTEERSKVQLLSADPPDIIETAGEESARIQAAEERFYLSRAGRRIWLDERGHPRPRAWQLLETLDGAVDDGLDAARYRTSHLRIWMRRARWGGLPGDEAMHLERTLTRAAFLYGLHLREGRAPADSDIREEETDLAAMLEQVLRSRSLSEALQRFAPQHPQYRLLREQLARYRSMRREGDWPVVPAGPTLHAGDTASAIRLATLRKRLRAEGYPIRPGNVRAPDDVVITAGEARAPESIYTQALADAVSEFQRRHGITVDGILGSDTTRELNVPLAQRITQIVLDMERWRALRHDPRARRHLVVFVPAFQLWLYENRSTPALKMPVVVGRRDWETPSFHDRITRVTFNPYWNVPDSIAEDELLPKIRNDMATLWRNRYEVIDAAGTTIDPFTIDWDSFLQQPYRIRQQPGPGNALGRIKFPLTNPYAVYLHDTPSRSLFARTDRAFSHGCIRVGEPRALAARLLGPRYNEEAIQRRIDSGEHGSVPLPEPVPVYVMYVTTVVNEQGDIEFHQDLYENNRPFLEALRRENDTSRASGKPGDSARNG